MPWCPKCKNEYVEGIKVCADCGCELVASLEEVQAPLTFGEQEEMARLVQFLEYNGLHTARIEYDGKEAVYEVFVSDAERKAAETAAKVFLQQEEERRKEQGRIGEEIQESRTLSPDGGNCGEESSCQMEFLGGENAGREEGRRQSGQGVYENAINKAENFKSSAVLLVIVGVLGLIADVLLFLDVLPLHLGANKYMTCGVMGALFVLFFVFGVLSFGSYRKLAAKAVEESALTEELKKWCLENFHAKELDADMDPENDTEEARYFKRMEKMKELVGKRFLNLEEAFLDNFLDALYPEIFGED